MCIFFMLGNIKNNSKKKRAPPRLLWRRGRNDTCSLVAQLVELVAVNHPVRSSSPSLGANIAKALCLRCGPSFFVCRFDHTEKATDLNQWLSKNSQDHPSSNFFSIDLLLIDYFFQVTEARGCSNDARGFAGAPPRVRLPSRWSRLT